MFGQRLVHGLNILSRMEFSAQAFEWNVESRAEEATARYQYPTPGPCRSGLQVVPALTP